MDKIHFLKDFERLEEKTLNLLKGFYFGIPRVFVKIHFGEPGNKFAFTTDDIKPIINALQTLGLSPVFIDTPVAYDSPRDSVEGYKKAVREKGYNKLAPFIISNNSIQVQAEDLTVEVCKELAEAKNVLVISHIKGHSCAGFGGAIKNLGMGGVTKETKSKEHGFCKPHFISECTGCGICAELCPAEAIKMENGKAELDNNVCWGCSICQINCPVECLAPEKAYFDDLLAQAASAVIGNLPKRTFYINILKNITKFCDCEVDPGKIIAKDVGILFSGNPVAIDKASVDLIREKEGRNVFEEENHKDPMLQIKYTSRYTGKAMDCTLKEV